MEIVKEFYNKIVITGYILLLKLMFVELWTLKYGSIHFFSTKLIYYTIVSMRLFDYWTTFQ